MQRLDERKHFRPDHRFGRQILQRAHRGSAEVGLLPIANRRGERAALVQQCIRQDECLEILICEGAMHGRLAFLEALVRLSGEEHLPVRICDRLRSIALIQDGESGIRFREIRIDLDAACFLGEGGQEKGQQAEEQGNGGTAKHSGAHTNLTKRQDSRLGKMRSARCCWSPERVPGLISLSSFCLFRACRNSAMLPEFAR